MPRFSEALRAGRRLGKPFVPIVSVDWPDGLRHYGLTSRRIGGLAVQGRLLAANTVSTTVPIEPGSLSFPDSAATLADTDGEISRHLEAGVDPTGCAVTYRRAMEGVAEADWYTAAAQILSFATMGDGGYSQTLNTRANDGPLLGNADKAQLLRDEFPLALSTSWGTFFRKCYGSHSAADLHAKGMWPTVNWCHDGTAGYRYAPCLGIAKSVPRVYQNGTLLTFGGDYAISYPIKGQQLTSIDLASATAPEDIITCDIDGYDTVGDGTGDLITNLAEAMKHWLANFAFGDWRFGPWNDPADYPIDLAAFSRAAGFADSFLPACSARFGGTAEAETIAAGLQRWLGTGLPFRPMWNELSELSLGIFDHVFHGYGSPGYASDVDAVYVRGRSREIGVSFDDSDDASNLISRVDLEALFGLDEDGRTVKAFQSTPVEDVTQTGAGAKSFALEFSEALLSAAP